MAPRHTPEARGRSPASLLRLGARRVRPRSQEERPASPLDVPSQWVEIDVRIDGIVLRALSKEPERRYRTANEFQTVVETVVDRPSTPPAHPESPKATNLRQPAKDKPKGLFRRWWWVFLLTAVAGPLLGVASVVLFAYFSPKKFEANAIVQIQPEDPGATISYPTYFAGITSKRSLEMVSEELDLPKRWLWSDREVIDRLRESITLQNIPGTDLIEIRVRSTMAAEATEIANSLASNLVTSRPGQLVTIHQVATPLRTPIAATRKLILPAAPIGFILSPLLGLALAALLHWIFPWRSPKVTEPETDQNSPLYGYLALGLLLAGTLGPLAMLPFVRKNDDLILFCAVAIGLGLLFGLKSPWARAIKVLLVIGVAAGLLAIIASALSYAIRAM